MLSPNKLWLFCVVVALCMACCSCQQINATALVSSIPAPTTANAWGSVEDLVKSVETLLQTVKKQVKESKAKAKPMKNSLVQELTDFFNNSTSTISSTTNATEPIQLPVNESIVETTTKKETRRLMKHGRTEFHQKVVVENK